MPWERTGWKFKPCCEDMERFIEDGYVHVTNGHAKILFDNIHRHLRTISFCPYCGSDLKTGVEK